MRRGRFEDYPDEPLFSPRVEKIVSAHNRAKRGTIRAEEQESNNSELFYLLTEMRE